MSTVVSPTTLDSSAAHSASASPRRSLRGRLPHPKRALSIAFAAAVLATLAWYIAPPALGGSTSFVTVDGTSMLPKLHKSDLVVLRPRSTYRVGDVVGYRSTLIHRVVLHRIVAIHNGLYSFKGDNNSFVDPEQPTRSQLVGGEWLHIPSAGTLVLQLHRPPIAAALAIVLVLVAGLGSPKRQRAA